MAHMKLSKISSTNGQRRLPNLYRKAILTVLCLFSVSAVRAVDGVWTSPVSGGLWSDTANWSGGVVAEGTDAIADFTTLNIGAHTTVNFDAPRTLGSLRFGDAATTTYNWTLSDDGNPANVLTLDGVAPAITVNNGTFSNNVVIAGTGGFAVQGSSSSASSLALGVANTVTGDLSVVAGTGGNLTLLANHAGALGGSPGLPNAVVLIGNSATRALLNLNSSGASYPAHHTLVMRPTGASSSSRAELRSVSGSATWNGGVVLDGISGSASPRCDIYCDAAGGTLSLTGDITTINNYLGAFNLRGANSGVINGNINVPGALMGKDDAGNWTLNSPNNNWASLQIYNGTLRLGVDNALPSAAPITFGSSGTAILDLNGFSQELGGNLISSGGTAKRVTNSILAASFSTVTYNTPSDANCAVPIGGKITLVKEGAANLTLAAASPYTGETLINNGTLIVANNGSIAATTNIVVGSGAVFAPVGISLGASQKLAPVGGTATLAGTVNMSSGTLELNYSAGNPGLTISGGNLIMSSSGVVVINVTGQLVAGQSYLLATAINGGQVSGSVPSSVTLNGVSGLSGYLVILNGELYLTLDTKPVITTQLPVSYTNQFTLFAGANPRFSVEVGGLAPFTYQWYTNGVLDASATGSSLIWPNVGLGTISAYCVVTNTSGAATSSVWSASVVAPPTAPYPVAVMSSNLLGYWRLNEPDNGMGDNNAGVIANDYWGGNNGLYSNTYLGLTGYSQSTDPATTAALFGIADVQNCAARGISGIDFGSPTNTSKAFTIEAWVAGFAPLLPSGIVSKGYGAGGEQFNLDADGIGHGFRFFVRDAAGVSRVASSSFVPQDAVWHHVVGVCDQPNGVVRLYVDGQSVASTSIPTNAGILAATSPMSIGARYSSAAAFASDTLDNQFFGYVNDVAIYNVALSASQVQAHYYAAGIAPIITSQPPATTNVNQNGTLIVSVGANGTQPLAYNWFDVNAGSYLPSQTNATLVISNLPSDNSYYLTVSNPYGTTNTSTVSVTVEAGFNVSLSPNVSGRKYYTGLPLSFAVTTSGTEPFHYRWLTNGVLVPGATNASYLLAVPLGSSSVSCIVSNSYNGLSSQTLGPVSFTGVTAPTNSYQLAVLSNAPVAYWPLNELDSGLNDGNPGAFAYDYVGGHNGVYTNAYLGLPGFNSAMYPDLSSPLFGAFASTDSMVVESDASGGGLANLNFAKPVGANAAVSVEAWVNLTNAIQAASLVAKGCGHSEQFALDVYNGGFRFVFRDANKTARDSGVSAVAAVGRWYHLVGVWDGASGTGRLFVNGTNVTSNTGLATGLGFWTPEINPNLPGANLVNIGSRPSDITATSYDVQFRGKIANVALYNYALSTNQIVAHYVNGTNAPVVVTPGLMSINPINSTQVQLTWNFSGTLQSATNVAGPYVDEVGAVSPFTVTTTNAQMFYRIKQQ